MAKLARLKTPQLDFHFILSEFLLSKQADGISPRTLEDYRRYVSSFLRASPNISDYDSLYKATIKYFSQPCSPGYRNIKLRYLRTFFNWCVEKGYIHANPAEGIKRAKEDIDNVRHVSLEEVKKLLQQLDKNTYTGLRDYCLMLV